MSGSPLNLMQYRHFVLAMLFLELYDFVSIHWSPLRHTAVVFLVNPTEETEQLGALETLNI